MSNDPKKKVSRKSKAELSAASPERLPASNRPKADTSHTSNPIPAAPSNAKSSHVPGKKGRPPGSKNLPKKDKSGPEATGVVSASDSASDKSPSRSPNKKSPMKDKPAPADKPSPSKP